MPGMFIVLTNHNKVQVTLANLKITNQITVAVCSLVFSRLIGFFLATQLHSINISGVHGFRSFTVIPHVGAFPPLTLNQLEHLLSRAALKKH